MNEKMMNIPSLSYASAGVDIDTGKALISAIKPFISVTQRPGTDGSIGGFGGLFDIAEIGYKDPLLVAASDGVGTKLKIAIETAQHGTVGQDLVAMCVNDLIVQGAEPLFFLDYFATGKLDNAVAVSVIAGIAEGCRLSGCALIGGETAEMPGMYQQGDYDLAGFSVGAVERGNLLPKRIKEGDLLLGLSSSGPHSNGYSLIRKIIDRSGLSWSSFSPFERNKTIAQSVLEPTRIYVKSILSILKKTTSIHAIAHITGGGLTENLSRVLPEGLVASIDLLSWKPSQIFSWLREMGNIDDDEMLRTFNCGIGMLIVCDSASAISISQNLQRSGEHVTEIGILKSGDGKNVSYSGSLDWK
ncbi:phosphoribosylformylglycinamidine cyclo-ligase [Candidatus Endowatersipora endosymbiont of Watersipora subatra]|uniref:phosphoribosylformylglycinamidine cyclo-ligase n=1 Tax=Candidatus Endowatersipora endosymbiont of Watersipora subatra TaxID=3077946 RepID=UPI00312CAC08